MKNWWSSAKFSTEAREKESWETHTRHFKMSVRNKTKPASINFSIDCILAFIIFYQL